MHEPVPDTAAAYDALAEFWAGGAVAPTYGIAAHERALAFNPAGTTALDVGCGSEGRLHRLLLARDYTIEALDCSALMVELLRRRVPEVTVHHADIAHWELPRRYDLITAWDSIWHLPLEPQRAVLAKLLAGLNPRGVLLFTAGGLDHPEEKNDSSMGPPLHSATLGIPAIINLIHTSGCNLRHLEFDQHPESHLVVIAQRPASAS